MKTIIIPTDFSNNAWKAAGYAANLYRNIPCRFILFHAYHVDSSIVEANIPQVIASKSEDINRNLEKLKVAFQEFDHHADSVIEASARYGLTSETIVKEAKNEFAEMIVMGTRGASPDEVIVVGSSTLGVLEKIPCPVICIPVETSIEAPVHIMFTTDYHNLKNLDNLSELKELAVANDSKISIVNIKDDLKAAVPIEDGMEGLALHNFLGDIPHEYYDHEENDVEKGIFNFAHENEVSQS